MIVFCCQSNAVMHINNKVLVTRVLSVICSAHCSAAVRCTVLFHRTAGMYSVSEQLLRVFEII